MRDTGRLSSGAPIVTATGLAFFGGTDENKMRAFDTRTGKVLWTATLPAAIYGSGDDLCRQERPSICRGGRYRRVQRVAGVERCGAGVRACRKRVKVTV